MTAPWTESDAAANHDWLRSHYTRLLKLEEPSRVLDVGCGSGAVLRDLREHGIEGIGLDQPGVNLADLAADGFEVREGSAYELPFADSSIDWVSLRHVPHHLEDPESALTEALRVARTGVLVAEPCFDASVPSQRGAIALDLWEKRQHRRGGMFHDAVYELGGLLELLPMEVEQEFELEVHRFLRLRTRSIAEFRASALELVADLSARHAERAALEDLLAELTLQGLSWNGSLCILLRRVRVPEPFARETPDDRRD